MKLTWLDSNSWLIELDRTKILLDPWLVGPLVFGNLTWLFKGERKQPRAIPENIDLILLSQGLEDHAHRATLKQLDKKIPVVASPNGAKVAQELGYNQVTTLKHKETFTLTNQLEIKAFPGSLIGPTTQENGYLLKDLANNNTLYYEPHGFHDPSLQEFAPVDIVITPIISLKIPLLGPVIKGNETALQVCQWLKPQVILATAAGGDVVFEGLLASVLTAEGSAQELRTSLSQNHLNTQVIEPKPGEPLDLNKSTLT